MKWKIINKHYGADYVQNAMLQNENDGKWQKLVKKINGLSKIVENHDAILASWKMYSQK